MSEKDVDALWCSGASTRNRLPSAETLQSSAMPGAWNSVVGEPTANAGPTLTGTEAIAPSGVRKKSSLPSPLHRGTVPPDLDTITLSPALSAPLVDKGANGRARTS